MINHICHSNKDIIWIKTKYHSSGLRPYMELKHFLETSNRIDVP
jgi:hypothetical protein